MKRLLNDSGLTLALIFIVYMSMYFVNKFALNNFFNQDWLGLILVLILLSYQYYLYSRK